ncbi:MAG: TatD family deoxyribonuclease [Gammaproteobacteria bacterium]|nr:TatD family deoxyribonuclease [Gammaproteobacteria bacterium]
MSGLIDIGANLLSSHFDTDLDVVLTRALTAGVERILITASNLQAVPEILDLIRVNRRRSDWPRLYCTAGIHPHEAASAPAGFSAALIDWFEDPDVVSAGEAGLDYNRNFSPKNIQREVFSAQIEAARAADMPLFVHDRESGGDTLELLRDGNVNPERIVIHCFTGTAAELDAYLDTGFCIGITGWVCDRKRGELLRSLVARIPLDRLLIETDAPWLLPQDLPAPARKRMSRRNEPATLPHIATTLAHLMQVDPDVLGDVTRANAIRFFRLEP